MQTMPNIVSILGHATVRHRLKPASVSIKPDESGCVMNLFEQV